jgi:hypothetical protein
MVQNPNSSRDTKEQDSQVERIEPQLQYVIHSDSPI